MIINRQDIVPRQRSKYDPIIQQVDELGYEEAILVSPPEGAEEAARYRRNLKEALKRYGFKVRVFFTGDDRIAVVRKP